MKRNFSVTRKSFFQAFVSFIILAQAIPLELYALSYPWDIQPSVSTKRKGAELRVHSDPVKYETFWGPKKFFYRKFKPELCGGVLQLNRCSGINRVTPWLL